LELIMHVLQRVAESRENDLRKNLLAGFLVKYRNLDEVQEQEFMRLLETAPYEGVKAMTTPWHEKGKADGQRQFLRRLLATKFGPTRSARARAVREGEARPA